MTFRYALYIHSYVREIVLNPENKRDLDAEGTKEIESILPILHVFYLFDFWLEFWFGSNAEWF